MDEVFLYVVSFLAVIALCVLCILLAKPHAEKTADRSKTTQVVRRADRVTAFGPGGYCYVEVPMSLFTSKSWDPSMSQQIAVLPFVSETRFFDSHQHNTFPYTPFLMACWTCDFYKMQALLFSGADPCQKTDEGACGMVLCAYQMAKDDGIWKPRCLKLLFKAGCPVDEPTKENNTALHLAVKKRSFKVVQWLIQHGADIHKENHAGWSPYQLAIVNGDRRIIDLMTSRQTHSNPPSRDATERLIGINEHEISSEM